MTDPQSLAALADIELPDAPPWPPSWFVVVAVMGIIVGLAALVWWRARKLGKREDASQREPSSASPMSPRQEALRRLVELRSQWSTGKVDDREASYRLCALLRLGMELPQLEAATPPQIQAPREWDTAMALLRRARYHREGRGMDERIFAQASAWLATAEAPRHV